MNFPSRFKINLISFNYKCGGEVQIAEKVQRKGMR